MALTNLTFGDSGNKTLLCSLKEFMKSLVAQLHSPSDELRQVSIFIKNDLFEKIGYFDSLELLCRSVLICSIIVLFLISLSKKIYIFIILSRTVNCISGYCKCVEKPFLESRFYEQRNFKRNW